MDQTKMISAGIVILVLAGIAFFFLSSETAKSDIPPTVTGEIRTLYEWAKTPEAKAALEQIPCYCGCKFEGHLHARHCFWRDNGDFDKHGVTCSVCQDIAKRVKAGLEKGESICTIRNDIDKLYLPNRDLKTPTPYPSQCGADPYAAASASPNQLPSLCENTSAQSEMQPLGCSE